MVSRNLETLRRVTKIYKKKKREIIKHENKWKNKATMKSCWNGMNFFITWSSYYSSPNNSTLIKTSYGFVYGYMNVFI